MKTVLIALSIASILPVSALANDKKFFVKGQEMTASQATLASLKGETEVYKCSQVEAKANKKSGNISLKAKDSE
jgi:hypothetical protein